MNFIRLKDILSIHKGRKNLITDNPSKESIRVLQIDDLRDDQSLKYTDEKNGVLVTEDDLMIAWDGANAGTIGYGKAGYVGSTIAALKKIEPGKYSTPFLGYFLKRQFEFFQKNTTGATIPHIDRKSLENLSIPDLSIEDQIRIATVLSKAEALIAQRKESIRLLDEFVRSTFLEMFGDPIRNEKGWDTKGIEQLVSKSKHSIKRGPFGGALKKEIFVPDGYLVYEQFHALNDDFSFARYFITEEKFKELIAFEVVPGDIIISCSGVYLGKLAIIPEGARKGIINQALLKISLDDSIINKLFFVFLFRHESFKQAFFGDTRGSGIPNFPPMNDFKKFRFIYPPFEIQTKFGSVVEKVTTLKGFFASSLKELENLFSSLSQRAFKGLLDLNQMQVDISEHISKEANIETLTPQNTKTKVKAPEPQKVETVAMQAVANRVIENYKGFHFSFEMLHSFIEREKLNYTDYFTSEEMKKNPKLNINPDNVEDLKSFVSSAIVNRTTDEQVPKNPWIKLNQIFYDASKPSASLNLKLEDLEKSSNRSLEDQSGIYFEIVS